MNLKILTQRNNTVLRKKSEAILKITPEILSLIKEMKNVLKNSENGVGLAAPQVGHNIRLFVAAEEISKEGHTVFVNPEITQVSKKTVLEEEGCLSLPDEWSELARPEKVTIKSLDETGQKFKIRLKGLAARLMLHEVDHLNGVLFVDYLKNKK